MNKKDKIEHLFKEGLDNHKAKPMEGMAKNDALWNAISSKTETGKSSFSLLGLQGTKLYLSSIIVALLSTGTIASFFLNKEDKDSVSHSASRIENVAIQQTVSKSKQENVVSDAIESQTINSKENKLHLRHSSDVTENENTPVARAISPVNIREVSIKETAATSVEEKDNGKLIEMYSATQQTNKLAKAETTDEVLESVASNTSDDTNPTASSVSENVINKETKIQNTAGVALEEQKNAEATETLQVPSKEAETALETNNSVVATEKADAVVVTTKKTKYVRKKKNKK